MPKRKSKLHESPKALAKRILREKDRAVQAELGVKLARLVVRAFRPCRHERTYFSSGGGFRTCIDCGSLVGARSCLHKRTYLDDGDRICRGCGARVQTVDGRRVVVKTPTQKDMERLADEL